MNVLVTASASPFAQALLPRLLAEPGIELVLGVDRNQGNFTHDRFVQVLFDLRSRQLARILPEVRAVIHLAPMFADDDRAAALAGIQHLCTLAHAAGVRHLVLLSSAFIYDTQRANGAVREDHARGAPAACAPAANLQAMEDWLDGFERDAPQLRVARLRPHWVLGPHSNALLTWVLRGRRTPRLPAPLPALQCLHEDDLIQAVLLALRSDARGAFNLAAKESADIKTLHRLKRWWTIPAAPEPLVRALGMDDGCAELLRRPLLLDTRRARGELGWRPQYDQLREILRRA
jgi:nucleoside-diphosphate-sugar epimerase